MGYTVNIFISSTFKDMHGIRDQLIYEIRPLISSILIKQNVDVNLNFIDLRWGVDEREFTDSKGKYAQVLEACFRSLDDTDILIGLYSDYRGIIIPNDEIDLINAQNQWELPYNNSLTELEYWYSKNIKIKNTKYCLVQFRESAQNSVEINEKKGLIIVNGNPGGLLDDTIANNIVSLIDSIISEKNLMKSAQSDGFMIHRKKQINQIVKSLLLRDSDEPKSKNDNSAKLIMLTGESGIGKSVLLSQLSEAINDINQVKAIYLADVRNTSSLDELLVIALREYGIKVPIEQRTLAEKIRYFRQNIKEYKIPCFVIDSIDDISREYFNQFLVELADNFRLCYVITSTTEPVGMEYKSFLFKTFDLKEFTKEELEAAIQLHEKVLSKRFPQAIKQKLLAYENTPFAKPIVFQLILNDLSWLSTKDYTSILDSDEYSAQIENIMLNRITNYASNINDTISDICTRITGNDGVEEENALVNKYLSLIILSYMGISESYMSNIMNDEWKPLLFYQLRYSLRSIFSEKNGLISISHRIFVEIFEKIISQQVFVETAQRVVNADTVLDDRFEFEKYRMCFFLEDFEKLYRFAHKKNGWRFMAVCLSEYCQTAPVLNKGYLSVPHSWIRYTIKQSNENQLSREDYYNILRTLYEFLYNLVNSTSTNLFDKVVDLCKLLINALIIFKKNSRDVYIERACNEVIYYYYQNVINCAEMFSVHEKVEEFVEEYELIVNSKDDAKTSPDSNEADDIIERMSQLFNIAKYKEDTDKDRNSVTNAYIQVLQLSIDSGVIFPNYSSIIEYLNLYSDKKTVIEYVNFVVSLISNTLKEKGGLSTDEIHYFVNAYHFKVMIELQKEAVEDNKDELIEFANKEYMLSKKVYEERPQDVRSLYDYSMACTDMALVSTVLGNFDKVKALNETIMRLKGYLYHHYPDTYLYAESYSAFIHNCSNQGEIYTEEQRIEFEDESIRVLMPYLRLKNIRASWVYLNHWEMIIQSIKDPNEISEYDAKLLIHLQKYLKELPDALNCIFESNENNTNFRKEAINRIANIYNVYRLLADRSILRVIAKSLYDVAVQMCEIEDNDSDYEFLGSIIETLCIDQSMTPQETLMDDSKLLKQYKTYIESKIEQQPKRIVLHYAMLIVPETEMLTMIGMLSGVEIMPDEAKLLFQMVLNRLNLDPISTILKNANEMIERMRIIKSLGGDIPQKDREILNSVLSFHLNSNNSHFNEITRILDELNNL